MFKTFKNAWNTPELKTKLLFTLLIIIIYRLGASIMVPWVNGETVSTALNSMGFLNVLAGSSFSQATLFALGVSPYITSSIIMQLLTIVIPKLEEWSKDGEEGKKKISAITRIVTIALAIIMALGYTVTIMPQMTSLGSSITKDNVFAVIVMVACYVAGASVVMWLAERINDYGIGNGISIILFANIISGLPGGVYSMLSNIWAGGFKPLWILWCALVLAIVVAAVFFIIWVTNSERRIPIQYAKRVVGRKMYGGQSSSLPLKLNMSGVMPVIFANSIIAIPGTIAGFVLARNPDSSFWTGAQNLFAQTKPLYIVLFIILLVAFAYFYILISFNPTEVANNIRNNGGAIPGIRPGKPTKDFVKKTLDRITFIGAIFLCVISALPLIVNAICVAFGNYQFMSLAMSGTSVLIVVGVILETERELEAQLTMRNYKGFLD